MAMTVPPIVETRVNQFMTDLVNLDAVEIGFNFFLTHRPDLSQANQENAQAELSKLLETFQKENPALLEAAVRQYVSQIGSLRSEQKISELLGHLHHAVNSHVVPPRMACESVLSCEKLSYNNPALWIASFKLVRKIVGGVDYKGVREIMKNCIEKAQNLPADLHLSLRPQVEALTNVLEYIFDRNAALLPGYFIVNEILKSYPETGNWPHWTLVPMVAKFLNSFRPAAAIVSCTNLPHLVPAVEYMGRANIMSTWKLEPTSLKFLLKGVTTYDRILPYNKDLVKPQPQFLRYLLTQTYSKDLINHVLSLKKPTKELPAPGVCLPLQKQMVVCLVDLMRMAEQETGPPEVLTELFRQLATDLIFFVLYQYVTFPSIIADLADSIQAENLSKGRDRLMWVLLQFISGSIQKNPSSDFTEVLRLYRMYSETEPLAVPDTSSPLCIEALAAAGIYVHLKKKAATESIIFGFPLPVALSKHLEFLESSSKSPCSLDSSAPNFMVPLLCNTFSTTTDLFQAPMLALVEAVGGSTSGQAGTAPMPGLHVSAALPIQPLAMEILDSLSVHSKMSLLHHIVTHILKLANTKSQVSISPGMVETYSRLLVYSELETLGIKGFMQQLLPKVFSLQAWPFLYTLLEIFSYRVHHVQSHFRLNLLTSLHSMATHAPNQAQLNLMLESAALRLITGLGNFEISSPKSQPGTNAKSTYTLYGDSEELNRMVILTLARTIHIGGLENNGGAWLKEVVGGIMQNTPHAWPSHTLENFPQPLVELMNEYPSMKDNTNQLKKNVDEDWNYWNSMSNQQEKINHFSNQGLAPTFLCLLWKMIFESEDSGGSGPISPVAYKVLERIGAKQLSAHLRTFCDYLVIEFSKSAGGGHVTKSIDATNAMIWKYNLITLDRLVLCMVLRPHEGNEAQVCFFIIQVLLLKPSEFRTRVNEFCRTMNPDHHLQQDWHEKHLEIHQKFPEKFAPEVVTEEAQAAQPTTLPIYYGNVCLRFIPVFDVVVHRFLELAPVQKSLETMFGHLGCLYKFHDKPITYLYNTLHYYQAILTTRPSLRRLIVSLIDEALKDVRPANWAFTQEIKAKYITTEDPDETWRPSPEYFYNIVGRMVAAQDTSVLAFPHMDWRFNEFPNEGTHAMYVTCVELLVLPLDPHVVGEKLVDVVLQNHSHVPLDRLPQWINAVGVLLSNLPDVYWVGLHNRIIQVLESEPLASWNLSLTPTQAFDFNTVHSVKTDTSLAYLLAVVHSTWHHAGFNQLCGILDLVRDQLIPLITTEEQMLFLLHMVGPFLQRLHTDRFMRVLFDLTIQIYELILRVDRSVANLKYMDTVCDLLYHIKYQFTGDSVKLDAERVVKQLRPAFQLRLRFIAQVPIKSE